MTKLDLVWFAQFKDDSIIKQFDDENQTQEHLFKEVLERQNELKVFSLLNSELGIVYEVNLDYGRVCIYNTLRGEDVKPEPEVSGNPDNHYRLIYFRRVTQTMSWNPGTEIQYNDKSILYFLGFQYTTPDRRNVKRFLQISSDGEVYLT